LFLFFVGHAAVTTFFLLMVRRDGRAAFTSEDSQVCESSKTTVVRARTRPVLADSREGPQSAA
jgi:hypothetical protein